MTGLVIKDKFNSIIARVNSSDGIILAIGICALILGVLVDSFVVRLICLLVVMGAGVLVYAVLHSKRENGEAIGEETSERFYSQSENEQMKKLVFDDFQSDKGEQYVVEDTSVAQSPVEQSHRAPEPVTTPPRAGGFHVAAGLTVPAAEAVREFQISDFFDIDSTIYRGDAEPRTEFDFLLNKVLTLIKEVTFAHTVAFFWANREKQQMIVEARVTESPSFMASRRYPLGHDLVSKIAHTGKPELLSEVNAVSEHELIRYYDSTVGIKSFIGVPVYFPKSRDGVIADEPVAVIAVDSRVDDQFGQETLILLGQYTKLVSALIKTYNDKYDLLLDAELLKSIRRLQEKIRNNFSLQTITQALAEETVRLVSLDFLSVVLYDESKHAWVTKRVTNRTNEGYLVAEQAIDFPQSVVGETIKNNAHRFVEDLAQIHVPRYFAGEKLPAKGSFISVPVSSLNKCYGALNLESRDTYNFSRRDIEMLYRLAENTASALEIYYMQDIINEYVIVDSVTGAYSKKFFLQRIEEELLRADESGIDLSMLLITVDKAHDIADRYGATGFERVMLTLAKAIRASVRSYDIVGRYDYNRFSVVLIDTPANDAYLWAEKIRKNVAAYVMNLDGKSFSVTISTGVCGALEGMRKEEFVGNTLAVLNKAVDAGGNVVRVF